jgi:catechol 2,3-dioxygenase-like lactoylglutathione lyase family enzyme
VSERESSLLLVLEGQLVGVAQYDLPLTVLAPICLGATQRSGPKCLLAAGDEAVPVAIHLQMMPSMRTEGIRGRPWGNGRNSAGRDDVAGRILSFSAERPRDWCTRNSSPSRLAGLAGLQEQGEAINVHVMRNAMFVGFIPVRDLVAARAFYADLLGLTVKEQSPFALVLDGGGTMLRLTPVPDLQPQPFTVAGWAVADIEAEVDALVSRGVKLNRYDGMDQNERGIWTTPAGDRVAWFCDPFSNTLSLTELATI